MPKKLKKLKGFQQIEVEDNIEEFQATYSPREWKQDPIGYFLIKLNRENQTIEVGFCNNEHKVIKKIIGKHPIEIYYTLIRNNLISKLEHAADMGVELEKAYIALKNNLEYIQDVELPLINRD